MEKPPYASLITQRMAFGQLIHQFVYCMFNKSKLLYCRKILKNTFVVESTEVNIIRMY